MKIKFPVLFAASLAMGALPAFAGSLNILWYTGGGTSDGGIPA